MNTAEGNGLLESHPTSEEEAKVPLRYLRRYTTLRKRLKWLGYDPGRTPSQRKVTERFRAAVRQFQGDAGITEDSWAGEQTWQALDALVGYESPSRIDEWFENDRPRAALLRAIQLRLWSLGLSKTKPQPGMTLPGPEVFSQFHQINHIFNISTELFTQDKITPQLVSLLFDQDSLVEALSRSKGRPIPGHARLHHFAYTIPGGMRKRDAENLATRFIRSVALIELYLLGFDVEIGKRIQYPISDPDANSRRSQKKMFMALRGFWDQFEEGINPNLYGASIVPEFFDELEQIRQAAEANTTKEEDYSSELAKKFKQQEKFRKNFWTGLKQVGHRLWDGIKRIWRWIKAKTAKILEVAGNLFRAFHRFALKAFQIVKAAGQAVVSSIQFLCSPLIPGSSEETAIMAHDRDGDFKIIVNPAASSEALQAANKNLAWRSWLFQIGAKVIGLLIDLIQGALTLIGWAKILFALVRSYSNIKRLFRGLQTLASVNTGKMTIDQALDQVSG